jgi:hypothetical protein
MRLDIPFATEHTRRKPGRRCGVCRQPIEPGQRYRLTLLFWKTLARVDNGSIAAHVECSRGREDYETHAEYVVRADQEEAGRLWWERGLDGMNWSSSRTDRCAPPTATARGACCAPPEAAVGLAADRRRRGRRGALSGSQAKLDS